MYAILQHGGHQYRVAPGDRLLVNRLTAEPGEVVALEPIVFLQDGDASGSIDAKGARVAATVVAHRRGPKLRIFKYKPKKRYRRTLGYRSDLTEVLIESVVAKGEGLPKPSWTPAAPADDAPAPVKRSARDTATAQRGATATEAVPKSATPAAKKPAAKPAAAPAEKPAATEKPAAKAPKAATETTSEASATEPSGSADSDTTEE
jgi:large subunit ribosomal protein L21